MISLRNAGVTIFLVDHLGNGGEQRGTSVRKNNLDNIINIKKPKGYGAQYGCKFDFSFDKFRGKVESDSRDLVKNRQFWYKQKVQGQYIWDYTSSLLDNSLDVLKDLVDVDLSLTQIAQRYGISQPTVTRMKQMFIDQGYLDENNGYRLLTENGKEFLRQVN